MNIMMFKEFDKLVKTYHTLENNRYLIDFIDKSVCFYKLIGDTLIKTSERYKC